jgi:hypothetical protein
MEISKKCKSLFILYLSEIFAGGITVNIGTPSQDFTVFLSPTADELIVSDSRCGITLNKCPKYCGDCK